MDFGLDLAQRAVDIALPPPAPGGGLPLMEALRARRSTREFAARELPLQLLSDLLWAAFGVNRPATGGRTAPSAHDWEEIDVYAALANGTYVYRAERHLLERISSRDLRSYTGVQPFVPHAPLNLVYVADLSRMEDASPEDREWYAGPDAGFIAENVYLFCAGAGLATVVRGMVDRPALARAMGLRRDQQIVLAQTVGFPASL